MPPLSRNRAEALFETVNRLTYPKEGWQNPIHAPQIRWRQFAPLNRHIHLENLPTARQ